MKRSFVILGAGISGLALGWFLKNEFGATIDLKIIEANRRVGGWMDTFETEGYLFDRGPHSVRTKDIAWFR
ncbi:MAG: NAD(P)-binding protein, partial [Chlamydiia bacterium]|nr:NAD(P)-binding protein [Chlamydiia bacterium]